MTMVIANGWLFGEDGKFRQGNICVDGDWISDINQDQDMEPKTCGKEQDFIDAKGLYVIPGLVDIHLHGCAGYDFCDGTPEAFRAIVEYEVRSGVTSIVPATMTLAEEELLKVMEACGKYAGADTSIKGITMEGPFISVGKKGAQNELYIQKPDARLFHRLQDAGRGMIRQVTVAPEVPGAMEFIEEISKECVVSVAHTQAEYGITQEAFTAGADHVTHLYNAMPPMGHRDPGVIGAAFDNKEVFVELICDGEHVHPSVVRATFQMFGAERICMISDGMRATGMKDGTYLLGGQSVWVKGRRATLSDGNLAASVSTLFDCMRVAVLEMQVPLEKAVLSCTMTPARALKLDSQCGVLKTGRRADIVVFDELLNIRYVIKDGKKILG